MTDKLIPADPSTVMVIRQITPNITTCSVPFARFGKFKVGGRGTIGMYSPSLRLNTHFQFAALQPIPPAPLIANLLPHPVRLQSGRLVIFSPVALTPSVRTHLLSLGNQVSYIIALDYEHHIFITEWAEAFPSAKLIGPEGIAEKRTKAGCPHGTKFDYEFTKENMSAMKIDEEFDTEFEYEYFPAHANKELLFYYKPEKTLIEADLVFNLPATEQYSKSGEDPTTGALTKLFIGLQNTQGTAIWQKRFIWYVACKDREGFKKGVERVVRDWDFERLIPCHGDVIETGGKGVFEKVMGWFLGGKQ
ncbi:MAG: hypothetical protein MMC33_004377 [Icmadophila ericetorum]|nr:hypothetical protein [Icmadophila ericetorum]